MKLLLDTHVLLWAAGAPKRLPRAARTLLEDEANDLLFSAASLWEGAIKQALGKQQLGREDFRVDARLLRRGLLDNGYAELAVTGAHAAALDLLPPLHTDPFDRMLIAQAVVEGITLVTADAILGRYPGPIRVIRS